VEQDPYCQAVLRHHWPEVPILEDIRDAQRSDFPDTKPDLVCGGFPCQPFSHAGKQLAQDDPRHLWPEMLRIIRELRPTWVVGENVVGLISLGLDEVLTDLETEGYATRTFNIPACAIGAPHIRQRVWVVAHADSESEPDKPFDGGPGSGQLGFQFGGSEAPPHGSDADDHRAQEHEPDTQHGQTQLLWPTPGAREKGGGEYQDPEKIRARMEKGHQTNLAEAVKSDMWPTPTSSEGTGAQKNIGRTGGRSLRETVQMFPTPTVQDSANNGGPSQFKRNSLPLNAQVHVTPETDQKMWQTPMVDDARGGGSMKSRHIKLHQQVKMWPTPTQDSASNRTKKYGQGGTPLPLALQLADPKTTGSLNPQWVAWLMGYPTEYLSCVHWETQSSRKSRNK